MNTNIGVGTRTTIALVAGGTPGHIDIRKWTCFAFTFNIVAPIAADAVFNVEYADPSAVDDCVPGTFSPVAEVSVCDSPAVAGPQASIVIPAGSTGHCSGTIPCKPGAFVRLVAGGGDTDSVEAVAIQQGPMMEAG